MPSDIFSRKHLFGSLAPLAERSQIAEKLDDLLLENIEALAAGESGDDSKCFGSGSIVCPLTNQGVAHVQIYYSLPH